MTGISDRGPSNVETRIVGRQSYHVDPNLPEVCSRGFKVLIVRCPQTLHLYLVGSRGSLARLAF